MPWASTFALENCCCCFPWQSSKSRRGTLHDSLISPQQCYATGGTDVAAAPEPQQTDTRETSLQQLLPPGSSNSSPDLQKLEQDHKHRDGSPLKRPSSPDRSKKNNSSSTVNAADSPDKRAAKRSNKAVKAEGIELKPAERNPCLGVDHIVAADRGFVKARPG